jgi:ankyrin repeat protein
LHALLQNESSTIEDALTMMGKYPAALQLQGLNGNFPLHIECENLCRSAIISKCIELYPLGLSLADEVGCLPLHLLILNESSSIDDILIVIEKYPDALQHANRDDELPLHIVLKLVLPRPSIIAICIERYPEALLSVDKMSCIGLKRYVKENFINDNVLSIIEKYTDSMSPYFQRLKRDNDIDELLAKVCDECVKQRKSIMTNDFLAGRLKLDPVITNVEAKPYYPLHKLFEESSSIEDALMVIEKYSAALQQQNGNDDLPLHIECKNRCRSAIISKCIELYPEALKIAGMNRSLPLHFLLDNLKSVIEDAVMMIEKYPVAVQLQNISGRLPLHIECGKRCRTVVITKCIQLYPETLKIAHHRGSLPLHALLENRKSKTEDVLMMIENYPESLQVQGDHGYELLPLHIECKYQCRSIIVRKCIELYPNSSLIADVDGYLPLHWLLTKLSPSVEDTLLMIDNCPVALKHKSKDDQLPLHIEKRHQCRLPVILKCIELFPESLSDINHNGYLPLHLLLADKSSSIDDAHMIINKYPAVLAYKDGQCQLPLHIECSNQCRPSIISKCIELYPEALKEPDSDGCLPLHLLLWNDQSAVEVTLLMIRKCPDTLTAKDYSGYLPINVECHSQCRVAVIRQCVELFPQSLESKDSRGKTPFTILLDQIRQANRISTIYTCLPAILYVADATKNTYSASYTKLIVEPCFREFDKLTATLKRRILLNLAPNDKLSQEKCDLNYQPRSSLLMALYLIAELWSILQQETIEEGPLGKMSLLNELISRSSLVDVDKVGYAVCQGDELGDHLLRHVISYL